MISDVDKRRIVKAIRATEEKTAGEIFCVIARPAATTISCRSPGLHWLRSPLRCR